MHEIVASQGLARATRHARACVHTPFERFARERPQAIALRFRDTALSYAELDRRANQLAHALRRAGAGPEVLVGHFVERSLDAVVALLAILKAGAAYVPLDPDNPPARTRFVLEDAKPRLVVTQSPLRHRLDGACLCIDEFDFDGDHGAPPLAAAADNLAYVIYTSGSTGQPKGTLVTHANVDRLFRTTEAWFAFDSTDVWTVFHSFAFDFSVWELWGALRYGGCAVVVPSDVARATAAFRALLDDERVTVLSQTPSAFNALIDIERMAPLRERSLRYVIFGGEALEFRRLAPWYERHGDDVQLVNMYGITETTVHTTYFPVTADRLDEGSVIGVPLPDLSIRLLDANLAPVTRGEVGEMYVGGPGVARGYLNRPELTAKRFVRDPLGSGDMLYRSGDLARLRDDGNLEFCGRIDDQVKLRGYRIELGEIEHALDRCTGVIRSAVVLRATERGDKELVAYLIGGGARTAPAALRDALAASLPAYMVPSAFVPIAAFPLTTNGKLDKDALPPPRREHRPGAALEAFVGDEVQIDLSPSLSASLRAYARQRRCSLFAVMVAGFAATLYRVAQQDDVVFGSGYASRDHRSLSALIGMIVNMAPLRIRFEADTTFAQVVEQANAAAHDASRNPLCQVAFSFHDSAMPPWRMGDITGEVHYPHNGSAKFDMNVIVVPHAEQQVGNSARDDRITLKWDFNAALFDRVSVERMVEGYLQLLESGVGAPATRVSALLDVDNVGAYRAVPRAPVVQAPASNESPRTDTERMVANVWARHFDCDGVGVHDDFFDSGGHSLAAASVFAELSSRTGVDLPLSLLFEARTIASLAHAIDERRADTRSALLIPVQRCGSKPPIFAMLGIGANFMGYTALAGAFGSDQPFYSLEMPGLDGRALPGGRIEDIVERLRKVVREVPGSERCVLLGACAGALVVYELARALLADGCEVTHVIMVDPPPTGDGSAGATSDALRHRFALPRFLASRMSLALRAFGSLDGKQRMAFLRAKARVVRDIVQRRDLLRESRQEFQFSRVREATSAAITQFAPRPYAGRVTLLVGDRYSLEGANDVSADWRTLCRGGFDVARVPGKDTGAMLKPPNLARITERLRTLLIAN